jgi:excisionase family DNA binding protein
MQTNDNGEISPSEKWVSVEQVADHLKVKTFTIYKWLERKDMPAHKVGRLWRFKITEIDDWVRKGGAAEVSAIDIKD